MNHHAIRIGKALEVGPVACRNCKTRHVMAALYAHCDAIHVQYQIGEVRWLFDDLGRRHGS